MRLLGEPVRAEASYRVTVNSFLAEGGDGFVLLKDGIDRKGGGQDLDALVDYLASGERAPDPTPRMTRLP
jgi:5'-nucleotidase